MNIKYEYQQVKEIDSPKDEHHTMKELYFQRTILWAIICNTYKHRAFKSKKHADGTMFDGDFVAVIQTDVGDYSFHIKLKYWNLFDIEEKDTYEDYDDHKPDDIGRLFDILGEVEDVKDDTGISYKDLAGITERNFLDRKDKKPVINANQFTPENLEEIDEDE